MAQQAFDKLDIPRLNLPKEPFDDEKFCKKAYDAFQKGGTKAEVAEQLGVTPAVAALAAIVHEHGPIPFRNEKEFRSKLVKARDNDGMGWAAIGARLGGVTEARVQRLYEEETGTSATESDLGKGGRPRGSGSEAPAKPAKKAAKKTAKKATKKATKKTAKKTTATKAKKGKAPNFGDEPTLAKVKKALEGKTVTAKKGNGTVELEVSEVQQVKQAKKSGRWGTKVTTDDGAERTIPLDAITAVA